MIIDLFAGMGGWTEGLASLGQRDLGIEIDLAACATRAAAGHATIRADVATFPLDRLHGNVTGLIASPPCTDWSQSGKRQGLDGETGALVLEVDRWVRALRPRWIACEQVPPALEWWVRFAREWAELGYSAWAGILNAADYGVPQTRKRAILMASLDRRVEPPAPSHDRAPAPSLFGDDLLPWVSMATALGWDGFRVGFPRADDLGNSPDGYRERDWRDDDDPSFTLTEKARSWVIQTGNNSHVTSRTGSKAGDGGVELYERPIEEPAPTLDTMAGSKWRVLNTGCDWKAGGSREDAQQVPVTAPAPAPALSTRSGGQWVFDRPATTVAGDPRLADPGHRERHLGENRFRPDAIRLTIRDALVLQSFRPDYPVTGTKTKQFEQVGNAIPPLLARRILEQLL